ncbi:MAG: response regulator transcription factor [Lachnospiraceae bacterium]|nr:response regulator transcription factor [Lachnospiraceae bacterium]
MSQTIYVADDEKNIRELIAAFLTKEGFLVETFPNGDALLEACEHTIPDLVVLDIMMPGTDGLTVCSTLRKNNEDLPIIIVSAKDSPYDRVAGLNLGSDDYLIKPFLPLELVARVRSLLRRSQRGQPEQELQELTFGALRMDSKSRTSFISGESLALTPTEFDFLFYLVEHADRAVNRKELLKAVWQVDWQEDTRVMDDLVKRLRRKLRQCHSPVHVETIWGYGFRIANEEDE